jgi:hypothetical protein
MAALTTSLAVPSRHDGVTMACPLCGSGFVPVGRRRFCSDACRAMAFRRRKRAADPVGHVPTMRPVGPITVYECDGCGVRAVGEQRCADCSTFMRRVGPGGACPSCDEAVTVAELLRREGPP